MLNRFTASQSLEIAVGEQTIPIQHYLRQPRRLVNALVDPNRLERLEADCFRLKMRPLSFMTMTIQPTVDMKVSALANGTVRLRSQGCEIRGIEYINQRFSLNLYGRLAPYKINGITYLRGQADLEVQVEVPYPLSLTPQPIIEATGNGLLKSVLLTIKQRLMHNLLSDYQRWTCEVADQGMATQPNSQVIVGAGSAVSDDSQQRTY
ncbi:DUF1997 domain-containing protein [Arthrospira platensis]|uniref:DUF1997 domain-containing protein n=1 Tax=Limnospira platensis TaxID=118562 RepID=UPI001684083F|nr:DUF1997 domain-containing protein [Arthrospira platensis]MBD2572505.1 DUF1997 domain-containing protein [Arthrospira platensis FACHB-971]